MKKDLMELVFILDRSGSMSGLESDTIGGFNSMIEKQKKLESEVLVTTVLFDSFTETLHDRVPLRKVKKMTEDDYMVGGCTALLDAIGETVQHIATIHKYAREEDRPEKTMFIITTDGRENSSTKYKYRQIKEMIEKEQKEYGWEFLFLGANINALEEAEKLGISRERAVNYECDDAGVELNYAVVSDAVLACRRLSSAEAKTCGSALDRDGGWKKRIEQDYEARHGKRK